MGADYEGDEAVIQERAIKELKALSPEAKGLLCHHIGNPLTAVLLEVAMKQYTYTENCVHHILEDLDTFGIRENLR
ncbi:MAG: hypothetical protein C4560_02895 [Nitrospiraceae bacterium]|nr:MAG: hypothetical protein C4560_02895 [Nitrospiraceae bacterium]